MALVKLAFKPGVQSDGSRYSSSGTWADVDKVRFRYGDPEKIGGWQKSTVNQFLGTARSLYAWTQNDGNNLLAIGTNLKFYIENGGSLNDVTPIRYSVVVANPFGTTNGSPTVVVTVVGHGAINNDFVTFSGASAVAGLDLNHEYQIVNILTTDTFTITASSNANATTTGGGATVTAAFQINTGLDTTVSGDGWGAGTWGGVVISGTDTGWGEAADVSVAGTELRLWTEDNYGQDLVFNPHGGAIYYWVAASGLNTRGVLLSSLVGAADVPDVSNLVIVSNQDQKVLSFGCEDYITGDQDRMLVRWSSNGDPGMWTPLETNTAGGIRMTTGSEIISALETKSEILVWTDSALHSLRYVGAPFEYGVERVGLSTIISQNATAASNDVVFWMGINGFYSYNGRVNPLRCDVQDYVFNNMNPNQIGKICGAANMSFNEVWWFYPSSSSEENDSFVAYNYLEDVWFYGTLERTYWIDRSVMDWPRAASVDGYVYYQEYGQDDGSTNPPSPIEAFIESGPIEIGDGDRFGFAWRMIPDITFTNSSAVNPSVNMTLYAQEFPGEDFNQTAPNAVTLSATMPIEQFTRQVYFRLRGRALTFKISSEDVGVAWRYGISRVDVRPDGSR